MTTPASPNPISMSHVATELGISNTGINMNQSNVRTLAGAGGSGTSYGMDSLRNKSAYTPMNIVNNNDSNYTDTSGGAGTLYCYPSVTVTLGTPGYTYLWAFTSNPNGHTLGDSTATTCSVSVGYANNSNFSGSSTLQCTVKDNNGSGNTVVATGITAGLSGDGNA